VSAAGKDLIQLDLDTIRPEGLRAPCQHSSGNSPVALFAPDIDRGGLRIYQPNLLDPEIEIGSLLEVAVEDSVDGLRTSTASHHSLIRFHGAPGL
jgi:hypothetical protein